MSMTYGLVTPAILSALWFIPFSFPFMAIVVEGELSRFFCHSCQSFTHPNEVPTFILELILCASAWQGEAAAAQFNERIGELISALLPDGARDARMDGEFLAMVSGLGIPDIAMLQIRSTILLALWRALNVWLAFKVISREIRKTPRRLFLGGETFLLFFLILPLAVASHFLTAVAAHCLMHAESPPERLRAFIHLFRHTRYYCCIAIYVVYFLSTACAICSVRRSGHLPFSFSSMLIIAFLTTAAEIDTQPEKFPSPDSDRLTPRGMLEELAWTCMICSVLALYMLAYVASICAWHPLDFPQYPYMYAHPSTASHADTSQSRHWHAESRREDVWDAVRPGATDWID